MFSSPPSSDTEDGIAPYPPSKLDSVVVVVGRIFVGYIDGCGIGTALGLLAAFALVQIGADLQVVIQYALLAAIVPTIVGTMIGVIYAICYVAEVARR